MSVATAPFDRRRLRQHKDRAAPGLGRFDFLLRRAGALIGDKLDDVLRVFPLVLDLGSHGQTMSQALVSRKGTEGVVRLAPSFGLAGGAGPALVGEEDALPLVEGCFDLIVSNLSLHWVNDLPGALIQANRCLRSDGLFLATLLGGDTLAELRRALLEAELELRSGAAPRISPMADLRDIAGLVQRAGFALPVVEIDRLTVAYRDLWSLLLDLRGMGETACHLQCHRATPPKSFWPLVAERYAAEADGKLPATFEIITVTGWRPARGQSRPLRPGSAEFSLAEALKKT